MPIEWVEVAYLAGTVRHAWAEDALWVGANRLDEAEVEAAVHWIAHHREEALVLGYNVPYDLLLHAEDSFRADPRGMPAQPFVPSQSQTFSLPGLPVCPQWHQWHQWHTFRVAWLIHEVTHTGTWNRDLPLAPIDLYWSDENNGIPHQQDEGRDMGEGEISSTGGWVVVDGNHRLAAAIYLWRKAISHHDTLHHDTLPPEGRAGHDTLCADTLCAPVRIRVSLPDGAVGEPPQVEEPLDWSVTEDRTPYEVDEADWAAVQHQWL